MKAIAILLALPLLLSPAKSSLVCPPASTTGADALVPIGSFSAIHQDAEHCTGYVVDLWRSKTDPATVAGLFHVCAGLSGDRPTALLEHLQYDPVSNALSFTAQLSLGSDYLGGGRQAPSHDVFAFHGHLTSSSLDGALSHTDTAAPHPAASTTKLRLALKKTALPAFDSMEAFTSNAMQQIRPAPSPP